MAAEDRVLSDRVCHTVGDLMTDQSHVAFRTSDYPQGLTIRVDDRLVYSLHACRHNTAPVTAGRNDGLVTDVMPGQGE